ncbi:MAG: alpha-amylase family protein [Deltaproteobacteria bacterium]|nr:alpha-amylase family protein [Deltaproteobacteria bacterium]
MIRRPARWPFAIALTSCLAGACAVDEAAPPRAAHVAPPTTAPPPAPGPEPVRASRPPPVASPRPGGPRTAFVHLFEWAWDDVARECESFLGPKGYAAVQVSPPQEHAQLPSHPWYERYQPVSYRLESRGGSRAAFAAMVSRCGKAGVHVYVDAVLNHMSFVESGVGSAGTPFTRKGYPGLYDASDFHSCGRAIQDWGSPAEIQSCELATCPDLDTGKERVRAALAAYLQDLVDLGVAGIRVDAAKHISTTDLADILGRVKGPLYVYQEVIDNDGLGVITSKQYAGLGDVTEFRYGADLSRVLRTGKLAWLETFGVGWGFLPSDVGIAFVDNHDNQRGHGSGDPLTFRERPLYELALQFMLAWPYGYPQIMSSYEFVGPDDGPPAGGALTSAGACAAGRICEHRWPGVSGMVGFRNATAEAFHVDEWWSDGDRRIAFSRGTLGFAAFNATNATMTQVVRTSMPPGAYEDVATGETVVVRADRTVALSVPPMRAIAIHAATKR